MNKYEAMIIIRPEAGEAERTTLFSQIAEAITKNGGSVVNAAVWVERRKFFFPIKKHREGTYYLVNFTSPTDAIAKIRHAYNLNENILRTLFTALGR